MKLIKRLQSTIFGIKTTEGLQLLAGILLFAVAICCVFPQSKSQAGVVSLTVPNENSSDELLASFEDRLEAVRQTLKIPGTSNKKQHQSP